jgi:hypothetical protein
MPDKKSKKSKKGLVKSSNILPVLTTISVEESRKNILNPRLGDNYVSLNETNLENQLVIDHLFEISRNLNSSSIWLKSFMLPDLQSVQPFIERFDCLIEIDLSKNILFSPVRTFEVDDKPNQAIKTFIRFINNLFTIVMTGVIKAS